MEEGFWKVRDSTTGKYIKHLKKQIKLSLPYWEDRWGLDNIDAIVWSMVYEDVDVRQETEDLVRMIIKEIQQLKQE